jgi:hypothetical protein
VASGTTALVELELGSQIDAWGRLGFELEGGAFALGTTLLRPTGAGGGIRGWTLAGVTGDDLAGLPTTIAGVGPATKAPEHPNGASRLDHLVVRTPRFDMTAATLEEAGLDLRRVRQAAPTVRQGFFWVGDTILELVEDERAGAAEFWGLVIVVADIDRAADLLGDLLGDVRPAVQPGRRIATVREAAGAGLPLALMTPHVKVQA